MILRIIQCWKDEWSSVFLQNKQNITCHTWPILSWLLNYFSSLKYILQKVQTWLFSNFFHKMWRHTLKCSIWFSWVVSLWKLNLLTYLFFYLTKYAYSSTKCAGTHWEICHKLPILLWFLNYCSSFKTYSTKCTNMEIFMM